jgi:hypothetical protein
MSEAIESCRKIGHTLTVFYSPPPAMGGFAGNLNVIENLFQLARFRIPFSKALDLLDRAIGRYERLEKQLYRQMFNPFFWVWIGFTGLLRVPFKILKAAGYNSEAIEQSRGGRFVKVVEGVAFVAGVLQALSLLGLPTNIVGCLRRR